MYQRLQALTMAMAMALAGCGENSGAMLGTLERDRVELIAEAQETIVEVAVREGESVTEGQLLLRLDSTAAKAGVARARGKALEAQQLHAEAVAGARKEQVSEARALLAGAQARAAAESLEFDRIEKLVADGISPKSALDRQRGTRDSAIADERAARERLSELLHGTRAEVVAQAAAALDAARAELAQSELSLERHTVRAPRAGVVDALPYELGERPPRGAPVTVLLAAGAPYARVYVPETLRVAVAPGDPAIVRIDGTGRDWKAEVRYISSEAAFTPYYALDERERARLAFLAEIVLTEPEAAKLPTGIPVEVLLTGTRAGT